MKKPKNAYSIVFSQRRTLSTCLSPAVPQGGNMYYLKAVGRGSSQHVGYAVVNAPGCIAVTTIPGKMIGTAKTRAEAAEMIDSYHRRKNLDKYWLWTEKPFWNGGRIARPAKPKKEART